MKKKEKNVYQKHKLSDLEQHKKIYSDKYKKYCSAVCACIQSVLAWSDLQWFQDVTVLAIQGWQKLVDKEEMLVSVAENAYDLPEIPYRGVKCLLTRFTIPYLSGFAGLDSILPELIQTLNLTQKVNLTQSQRNV